MSKIRIKPSHKGLLHRDLGVSQDAPLSRQQLEHAKRSPDPAVRKRATFAINARSWHHTK